MICEHHTLDALMTYLLRLRASPPGTVSGTPSQFNEKKPGCKDVGENPLTSLHPGFFAPLR
jgi:hypothetical protein